MASDSIVLSLIAESLDKKAADLIKMAAEMEKITSLGNKYTSDFLTINKMCKKISSQIKAYAKV